MKSRKILLVLGLVLLCLSSSVEAIPFQVILIRHAEKPVSGGNTLSMQGRQRAAALAPFFINNPLFSMYGLPAAIFAQAPKHINDSVRPIETVTPLANALNQTINTGYFRDQHKECAKEILTNSAYNEKMVLCCFEHQAVRSLAKNLGIDTVPSWPKTVYDWVWMINFDSKGNASLQIIPQQLMYGDSATVSQ